MFFIICSYSLFIVAFQVDAMALMVIKLAAMPAEAMAAVMSTAHLFLPCCPLAWKFSTWERSCYLCCAKRAVPKELWMSWTSCQVAEQSFTAKAIMTAACAKRAAAFWVSRPHAARFHFFSSASTLKCDEWKTWQSSRIVFRKNKKKTLTSFSQGTSTGRLLGRWVSIVSLLLLCLQHLHPKSHRLSPALSAANTPHPLRCPSPDICLNMSPHLQWKPAGSSLASVHPPYPLKFALCLLKVKYFFPLDLISWIHCDF